MGMPAGQATARLTTGALASIVSAICLPSCAGLNAKPGTTPTQEPHPMLAAARSRDIRLFGELPGGPAGAYFTRSAMSLRQHSFTDEGMDADPDVDATGDKLVFASTRHNRYPDLYIKAVEGVAVTQLTADPASDVQPAFSSDDSRVAFASDRSGNWDIWVVDVQGGRPMQITSTPHDELHPSWSPDGSQLVYCRLGPRGGQWELWISAADGAGSHKFIGYGLFPEWSPAGNTIVFQRARERGSRWFSIWTVHLDNGEPSLPTEVAFSAHQSLILPAWAPAGNEIAFAASENPVASAPGDDGTPTGFDIWVMHEDGSRRFRLTDGYGVNYAPVFGPGGRVFFTSNRGGRENIWSQEVGDLSEQRRPDDVITRHEVRGAGRAAYVQDRFEGDEGAQSGRTRYRDGTAWKSPESVNSLKRPSED